MLLRYILLFILPIYGLHTSAFDVVYLLDLIILDYLQDHLIGL